MSEFESPAFATVAERDLAMELVKAIAADAEVDDQTGLIEVEVEQ